MNLITKQEASALGLTRYRTGQPCSRGHVSDRLTNGGPCVQCMSENKKARAKTQAYKDQRNAHEIAKRAAANPPKPCVVCGTVFDPRAEKRANAHTCGAPKCEWVFRTRNTRKKPDRECIVCGNPFASRRDQIICSPECWETQRIANLNKICLQCEEPFVAQQAGKKFCSACVKKRIAVRAARQHKNYLLTQPEKRTQEKLDYRMRHPEQHRITTRNVNARRIEREVAALTIAREMIPHTIKTTKGMRAKIKASREFLQSLGVERPTLQAGETKCPPSTS
jgi:predicted nucleic acid-binding Zn ribbon protein